MNISARLLLSGALIAMAAPAFAADLSTSSAAVVAPPKPAATTNVLTLEFGPEFKASNSNLADVYGKVGLQHTFADGLIWAGTFQDTYKNNASNENQQQLETTVGYNFKIDPTFTITSSAGVGYLFDTKAFSGQPAQNFAYYVLNAGLNVKINSQWTWNAVSARYRNAFQGKWATPKVSTGVTYTIDPRDQVYTNVGYGWKDTGAGYAGDKLSVAFGYKYGF